jgi:RNA polymerase sigma factor for flagellar operon FliA
MTSSSPAHRALSRYQDKSDLDKLVREHGPLIDRCARSIVRRIGSDSLFDDLWSAGAMGLIDASKRFKPGEGEFNTYVEHRVRGAMLDTLRQHDHLPRRMRTRTKSVEQAKVQLTATLGQEPTVEELASHLGIDVEDVDMLLRLAEPYASFESSAVGATLAHEQPDASEILVQAEVREELRAALAELPERLTLVMALRYQEGLTFREIGSVLSISDVRAAQLHASALSLLKQRVSSIDGGEISRGDR